MVDPGCQATGSTRESQCSASSSLPSPGTATWQPRIPCCPGGLPVPSDAMLVAVVAGNPAVSGRPDIASSDRNGAAAGCSRSSSQPSPSTTSRQTRSAYGSRSGFGSPGTPSADSTDSPRSARLLSP